MSTELPVTKNAVMTEGMGAKMSVTENQASGLTPTGVDAATWRRVHPRRYGQWAAAVACVAFLGFVVWSLANAKIEWEIAREYLFEASIMEGLRATLVMTVLVSMAALALGTVIAVMTLSSNPVTKAAAAFYVYVFRGTPTLLQLLLWFNIALIYPTIAIPGLWSTDTVTFMTPFMAAFIGLSLADAAYTSEIIRGGILSIDPGQTEAAQAVGLSKPQIMRRIILPQAMRVIVPPFGNSVIGMLKYTSLAAVISYNELLRNAQIIYAVNTRVVELLMVCAFWYLVCVSVLSVIQHFVEKYFARGFGAQRNQTSFRLRMNQHTEGV
ncbi:Polar amino acid ABC transporter inner membrane subunit (modular protein) [metagenome]|uniref:Polar amino acid ABC transporter inner membrane subunit (Modular protein) n=1 Tax=metagenome TaxID=256318 RepID=A0A2P2C4A0_9ZZZZ